MTRKERLQNRKPKRQSTMQKYVYYAVAIAIALVVWKFQNPRPVRKTEPVTTAPMSEQKPTPQASAQSTPSPTHTDSRPVDAIDEAETSSAVETRESAQPSKAKKSIVQSLPKVSQVREEVKRDPHSPPPSGARFALALTSRMEDAESSPEKAEKVFAELEECASNRDESIGVPSMKALCIQSARDLVATHPEFRTRFEELKKKADPRALSIAEQVR